MSSRFEGPRPVTWKERITNEGADLHDGISRLSQRIEKYLLEIERSIQEHTYAKRKSPTMVGSLDDDPQIQEKRIADYHENLNETIRSKQQEKDQLESLLKSMRAKTGGKTIQFGSGGTTTGKENYPEAERAIRILRERIRQEMESIEDRLHPDAPLMAGKASELEEEFKHLRNERNITYKIEEGAF